MARAAGRVVTVHIRTASSASSAVSRKSSVEKNTKFR